MSGGTSEEEEFTFDTYETQPQHEPELGYGGDESQHILSQSHPDPSLDSREERKEHVHRRWLSIPVSVISDVKVHATPHTENEMVRLAGWTSKEERSKRGLLNIGSISFSFQSIYKASVEELSASIKLYKTCSNFRSLVSLGAAVKTDENGLAAIPLTESSDAVQTFSMVVPVHNGIATELPLLDQFSYHGQRLIHHTVEVPGACLEGGRIIYFSWYIRLVIDESNSTISLGSVSKSCIDSQRIALAWESFKTGCSDLKNKLKAKFSKKPDQAYSRLDSDSSMTWTAPVHNNTTSTALGEQVPIFFTPVMVSADQKEEQ